MLRILILEIKFLAFYHLLTQALFKYLLFTCAGIIIRTMDVHCL